MELLMWRRSEKRRQWANEEASLYETRGIGGRVSRPWGTRRFVCVPCTRDWVRQKAPNHPGLLSTVPSGLGKREGKIKVPEARMKIARHEAERSAGWDQKNIGRVPKGRMNECGN